jgi:diguanylate cyclase (GGDEF)-like protein
MSEAGRTGAARHEGRVLVVDDSRVVRALIASYLRAAGFAVEEAEDGRAAVSSLSDGRPGFDAVVTDLKMPELDGFAVLEECRKLEHAPEVVILSGSDEMDAAIRALRLGAHDFLQKPPATPDAVVHTVALAVEKKRLQETNARLLRELEALTRTDALTGALNRRAFDEALRQEVVRAQRYDLPLSVLMVDVDHFKSVNDTYGHPGGDEVLRNVAARVETELRLTDALYRYGGEEFAVILPHTAEEGALQVAERLVRAVAGAPVHVGDGSLRVTISAGVGSVQGTTAAPSTVLSDADRALYAAKRSGRNRACTAPRGPVALQPEPLVARGLGGSLRAQAPRRRRERVA